MRKITQNDGIPMNKSLRKDCCIALHWFRRCRPQLAVGAGDVVLISLIRPSSRHLGDISPGTSRPTSHASTERRGRSARRESASPASSLRLRFTADENSKGSDLHLTRDTGGQAKADLLLEAATVFGALTAGVCEPLEDFPGRMSIPGENSTSVTCCCTH